MELVIKQMNNFVARLNLFTLIVLFCTLNLYSLSLELCTVVHDVLQWYVQLVTLIFCTYS